MKKFLLSVVLAATLVTLSVTAMAANSNFSSHTTSTSDQRTYQCRGCGHWYPIDFFTSKGFCPPCTAASRR